MKRREDYKRHKDYIESNGLDRLLNFFVHEHTMFSGIRMEI